MIRVLSIFGTRPEAIKMAPVIQELKKRQDIDSVVCVTAQHRQMLDNVLKELRIVRNYDLNIMTANQTPSDILIKSLPLLDEVVKIINPDLILVQGDTTTSLAGALVAYYNHIDLGHIEAGLRTYDKNNPYPEELNRQMVDRMASLCFAPTELNKQNLLKENINESDIYITGNTTIDVLSITINSDYHNPYLDWVKDNEKLILFTAHRRENIGEPLRNIFKAIIRIVDNNPDIKVIYPIHLNPEVIKIAKEVFGKYTGNRIKIIEPLGVIDFHNMMNKAYMIMSDSGGIQEEATYLGKPVLVLRDTTERPEGICAGTLKLVGTDEETIYKEAQILLTDKKAYEKMSKASNPYGDGHASERIVDAIIQRYKSKDDMILERKKEL